MKYLAPMVAAVLLTASGCGVDSPRKPVEQGEERHPSNDMNPLPKEEPVPHERPKAVKRTPAKPPGHTPSFEDPRKIPAGLEYSEMVRRFGTPTMKVTDSPGRTTYSYSKLKTQVQVEVQNGKVVAVAAINTGF